MDVRILVMLNIRQMMETDILNVSELIQKTHRISFKGVYDSGLIDEFCRKYSPVSLKERMQNILYFIAEDSESKKLLGIIGLSKDQIRSFYVDPEFQRQGIGKLLYMNLEAKARKNGIKKLWVEASPVGKIIYQKLGFKKLRKITKIRNSFEYEDIYMEKELG